MSEVPWRAQGAGLVLHVRLTPKGGRDAIDGIEQMSDGRAVLKARVRAVPEDGKANDALVKLVAKALRLAPSAIEITAGQTARIKTLTLSGDPAALSAALSALAPPKA